MEWIRVKTNLLSDFRTASLPDDAWRAYMGLDLLCGSADGPVAVESLSWALRRDCTEELRMLEERGLVVRPTPDTVITWDWYERNQAYLNKLRYNRDRDRAGRPPAQSKEADVNGDDVQKVVEALKRAGVAGPTVQKVVNELTGDMGFDDAFPESGRPRKPSADWGKEEWRAWANADLHVYNAPAEVQEASYHLQRITGFRPTGKSWIADVRALLDAADNSMPILVEALQAAAVDSGRLTFKGPRSFVSYAKAIVARRALDAQAQQPAHVDLDATGSSQTVEL